VLKFSIPKKRILIFIKYFLEKKSSLSHHITKENIPTPFFQLPHPTPPKKLFLRIFFKSYLPTLKNNQTFPSHATQETTPWVSPHRKKNYLSQSHIKELLWKGVELSHPPLTKKKPFLKRKMKFLRHLNM
jgi:hypothetical protein